MSADTQTPGWCWTDDIEAERWFGNFASKGEALLAAQQHGDGAAYWVAPLIPATEEHVENWLGDDDIELGDLVVDVDNIEEFPE